MLFASFVEARLGEIRVDDRLLFTAWIEYTRMKNKAEADLLGAYLFFSGNAAAPTPPAAEPAHPASDREELPAPAPVPAAAALPAAAACAAAPAPAAASVAPPAAALAAATAIPPPPPPGADPLEYLTFFANLTLRDLVWSGPDGVMPPQLFAPEDPFRLCPCCCFNPLNPTFRRSWCMDACEKLRQHSGTARSQRDRNHTDRRFFGGANERAAARSQTAEAALRVPIDHSTCATQSNYGKPDTAVPAGPARVHNITGACCGHGLPLLGCWIAALKPECYLFYHEIMNTIISFNPGTLQVAYLDFGCQYGPSWKSMPEAETARTLRFVVPWFHARGHTKQCQLINGGLHALGAAHVVGELMEQLWPLLEVIKSSLMYMGTGRMVDVLSLGLDLVAADKRLGLIPALDAKLRSMNALQAALVKRRAGLVAKAAELISKTPAEAEAALVEGAAALTASQAAPRAAPTAAADPDFELGMYARLRLQAEAAPQVATTEVAALFGREAGPRTTAVSSLFKELAKLQARLGVRLSTELHVSLPASASGGPTSVSWLAASAEQLLLSPRFREVASPAIAREVRLLEVVIEDGIRAYGAKAVERAQRASEAEVRRNRAIHVVHVQGPCAGRVTSRTTSTSSSYLSVPFFFPHPSLAIGRSGASSGRWGSSRPRWR